MVYAFTFLFERLIYRIIAFFRDWYVRGSRRYWHGVIAFVEALDRRFALLVTLKHLFTPLYGDYSVIGYVLGFFFRFLRALVASACYACVFALALAAYAAWVALPLILLAVFISGLFGEHVL